MNKIFMISLITITLVMSLVHAEVGKTEFNQYLSEFNENGKLSPELIEDLENLDAEQRKKIILKIDKDSTNFWNQWEKDLTGKQQRDLLREVPVEERNKFMEKFGKQLDPDLNLVNMGHEEVLHGDDNVVGNSKGYVQMDRVKGYNLDNPDNKIISIEYKETNSGSSLIFMKQDGSTLDLTVGESERGFYYDPEDGEVSRIGTEGVIDRNDPLSGNWNGEGKFKIDATTENVKMSFELNEGDYKLPRYSNSRGEKYAPHSTIDKNLKNIPKTGEITFNRDGRLTKISNMYTDQGEESWGGFFGDDTAVTYNNKDYESTEGTKILITNQEIKADAKRVQAGSAGKVNEILTNLQKKMGDINKKLGGSKNEIIAAHGLLLTAEKGLETAKRFNFGIKTAEKFLSDQQTRVKNGLIESLGLNPNNDIHSKILTDLATSQGLTQLSEGLEKGFLNTGAAGDLAGFLSKQVSKIDHPLLSSLNPAEGTNIDLHISNQLARELKKVEMYAGKLHVTDSNGRLSTVVSTATSHGYNEPGEINNNNRYFEGIDFELNNKYYKNGESIRIHSVNGKLRSDGFANSDNIRSVQGEFVVNAGGGITYGLFRTYKGEYRNVLTADYEAETTKIAEAKQFQAKKDEEYRIQYEQFRTNNDKSTYKGKENVWTSEEIRILDELTDNNFIEYNQILNSGKVRLTAYSSELTESLNKISPSSQNGNKIPKIIKDISDQTFYKNKNIQRQLLERGFGITDVEKIVGDELKVITNHIRSNPGSNVEFNFNPNTQSYQLISNGVPLKIDAIAGPFISNIFPVVMDSGGVNDNGQFYIDTQNSRFGRTIDTNIYGGHYWALEALFNSRQITANVESTTKFETARKLKNPASGTNNNQVTQVYTPTYNTQTTQQQTNNQQTTKRRSNRALGGGARGYRNRR